MAIIGLASEDVIAGICFPASARSETQTLVAISDDRRIGSLASPHVPNCCISEKRFNPSSSAGPCE